MNATGQELGLADSHFVRPDGLDAPHAYSSARDVTRLALAAMRIPIVRELVAETDDTIAGGRALHTWNDLLGVLPGVFGVKTGHTATLAGRKSRQTAEAACSTHLRERAAPVRASRARARRGPVAAELVRVGRPLTERVVAPTVVSLPVTQGQVLGRVEVWNGDQLLASQPLVASRSVARPSAAGRLRWYAPRTAHHVLALFT
jgi:D-alanyl-D-alanine carboxypeptidase